MASQRGGANRTNNDGQMANFVSELQRPNQYQSDLSHNEENELLTVGTFAQAVAATQLLAGSAHVYQSGPLRLDEDISRFLGIYATHGGPGAKYGKPIAKTMVRAGTPSSFVVWLLVMIIGVKEPFVREQLFNLYIGVMIASTVVRIMRLLIRREKPHWVTSDQVGAVTQDTLERHCFPSGSATLFALGASFIVANYQFQTLVTAVAVTVVVSSGLVHIMLGRHFVTDVLFGWLLGILIFVLVRKVIWVPAEQCDRLIKPFRDVFHL